jgi:hypothetical protein
MCSPLDTCPPNRDAAAEAMAGIYRLLRILGLDDCYLRPIKVIVNNHIRYETVLQHQSDTPNSAP